MSIRIVYSLIDLLPHSDMACLSSLNDRIRALQVIAFFARCINMAILSFISQKCDEFDAQVSENLCQIRAYWMVYTINKNNDLVQQFKNNLKILSKDAIEIEVKCEVLLTEYKLLKCSRPSHYTKTIDKTITLKEFLGNENIEIKFCDLSFFLIQSFILSCYKLVGNYEISSGIDYDKLCAELELSSKTYARKIVHVLQRNLSKQSCQFVYKLLSDLHADPIHINLLNSLYAQDEVGRHVIACYEATRVILQHAYQTNRYVKIIVNRVSETENDSVVFFLKPSLVNKSYLHVPKNTIRKNEVMLVFAGITRCGENIIEPKEKYIERFLNVGIENIIMANMAQHPQYAGLLLNDKKFNPYQKLNMNGLLPEFVNYIKESEERFLKHKYLSARIGCSENKSDLFLLTHVRSDYHESHSFQPDVLETIM